MPMRKLHHDESRILIEIPTELKRRLEHHLTPPGATKPPYGAMKRFFERKVREFCLEQQKKIDRQAEKANDS